MHLTEAFERRRARGLPQPWPTFADWALEVLCSDSDSDSIDKGSKLSIEALCDVLKEVFRDELDASHSKSNKDLDALARRLGLPHRVFLCLLFGPCILISVRSYNELSASVKKLWKTEWQGNDKGETHDEIILPAQAQAQARSRPRAGTLRKARGKGTAQAKPDNDLEKGQELQLINDFRTHIYASILARRMSRLSAIRSKKFKAGQSSIDRVTFATSHHKKAFSPSDFHILAADVQEHQEEEEEAEEEQDENEIDDDDDDQEDEEAAAQEAVEEEDVATEVQDEYEIPESSISKTLHMRKARTTMPGSTIFRSSNDAPSSPSKGRASQSDCANIDAKLTLCK